MKKDNSKTRISIDGLPLNDDEKRPKVKIGKPNYNINELEIGKRYEINVDNSRHKNDSVKPKKKYNGTVEKLIIDNDPKKTSVILKDVTTNDTFRSAKVSIMSNRIKSITKENHTFIDIDGMHQYLTDEINKYLGGRKSKKVIKRKRKKSLKKNKKKTKKRIKKKGGMPTMLMPPRDLTDEDYKKIKEEEISDEERENVLDFHVYRRYIEIKLKELVDNKNIILDDNSVETINNIDYLTQEQNKIIDQLVRDERKYKLGFNHYNDGVRQTYIDNWRNHHYLVTYGIRTRGGRKKMSYKSRKMNKK
tara:strand:- start:652 stop:1566 length:915 start_codon:yes stop_codon:yes gene_type:complete